jgi:DNA-binding GntR family transcriptional regulator
MFAVGRPDTIDRMATSDAYEPMAQVVARRLHEQIVEGRLKPGAPIR